MQLFVLFDQKNRGISKMLQNASKCSHNAWDGFVDDISLWKCENYAIPGCGDMCLDVCLFVCLYVCMDCVTPYDAHPPWVPPHRSLRSLTSNRQRPWPSGKADGEKTIRERSDLFTGKKVTPDAFWASGEPQKRPKNWEKTGGNGFWPHF